MTEVGMYAELAQTTKSRDPMKERWTYVDELLGVGERELSLDLVHDLRLAGGLVCRTDMARQRGQPARREGTWSAAGMVSTVPGWRRAHQAGPAWLLMIRRRERSLSKDERKACGWVW